MLDSSIGSHWVVLDTAPSRYLAPVSCQVSSAKYADIKYSLKGSTESPKAFISLSEQLKREREGKGAAAFSNRRESVSRKRTPPVSRGENLGRSLRASLPLPKG